MKEGSILQAGQANKEHSQEGKQGSKREEKMCGRRGERLDFSIKEVPQITAAHTALHMGDKESLHSSLHLCEALGVSRQQRSDPAPPFHCEELQAAIWNCRLSCRLP